MSNAAKSDAADGALSLPRRLEALWEQGQRPDVHSFLAAAGAVPLTELAAALGVDQWQRWHAGQRVPAEDYLRRYPPLEADPEHALELVYGEFLLREELGEKPAVQDYLRRFPRYQARLGQQFQLHQALDRGPSQTGATAATLPPEAEPTRMGGPRLLPTGWPDIPGYEVLSELGQGGMGVVYKARHVKLGRIVALKVIRKDRLQNQEAARRFYREVQAVARLSHPNIVRAYDAGQAGSLHFFSMEFVEGIDLARLVQERGPLPLDRAVAYARQVALGLEHAHKYGLIHRDIKPANLLLAARGEVVKILDLGLARLRESAEGSSTMVTQEGALMGTPDFLAPEQAQNAHAADIRSDLYSLGCTLYFLLTAQVPFPGGGVMDKLFRQAAEEPRTVEELRPEVPPALATVVRRLMAKRPEDRYPTPAAAAAALAAVLVPAAAPTLIDRAPIATVPPARPATAANAFASMLTADPEAGHKTAHAVRRASRRERWLLAGLAGCLLLGLLVLLWSGVLSRHRGADPEEPNKSDLQLSPNESARGSVPKPFARWLRFVAALSAEQQVEAVAARLKQHNPDFDGTVKSTIEGGVVTALEFSTDKVTDLRPVRALVDLKRLTCRGKSAGKLSNLGPLHGLRLTSLNCSHNPSLSDLAPLGRMALTVVDCAHTTVASLKPLQKMPLTRLSCATTQVADLAPLKGMGLTFLDVGTTHVSNLTPLQRMPLSALACSNTPVSDLTPLKGMPLTRLECGGSRVSTLAPLAGLKLIYLNCGVTDISDLAPLKGMPLQTLYCHKNRVTDLTALQTAPLKELWYHVEPERDAQILRSIKTLTRINGKAVVEFWKDVEAEHVAFAKWASAVAKLPPAKQVEAVAAELKKRNPGFDGTLQSEIRDGAVVALVFHTDHVTDIRPVRALPGLKRLSCSGVGTGSGKLTSLWPLRSMQLTFLYCAWNLRLPDLSPLKGMPLTYLGCLGTEVGDLTPLRGMKLTHLDCTNSPRVSDLSPLKGMPLTYLGIQTSQVSDLTPLRGMPLIQLVGGGSKFTDLSPLRGMPLRLLNIEGTPVTSLEPLRGMSLTYLHLENTAVSDLGPLRGMPLTTLSCAATKVASLAPLKGMKLTELWISQTSISDLAPLQGMPLKLLSCPLTHIANLTPLQKMPLTSLDVSLTQVSDLGPLRGLALRELSFDGTQVSNLSPIKGMPLWFLTCNQTGVADLTPLRGMKLTNLAFHTTPVADLRALKGMPLTLLTFDSTRVADLKPLEGMKLTVLSCTKAPVTDLTPLRGLPLQQLWCDLKSVSAAKVVRSIQTLKQINGKPAAVFWKEWESMNR